MSDALHVRLTGKKGVEKIYKHHSGFIGGLKEVPITRMRERRPEDVSPPLAMKHVRGLCDGMARLLDFVCRADAQIIRRAVSGMLPKNTFRERRLDRLKIFPAEAPESVMGNVLRTWRDETGGQAFRDVDPATGSQGPKEEIRA